MSTVGNVLDESRNVFLNDAAATLWTNTILLPYFQRSYKDLLSKLNIKNVSQQKEVSTAITVNALAVTLTLPADFASPVKLEERPSGSSDLYTPMTRKEWETNITQIERLRYWIYREEQIKFPGATQACQVLLYYMKNYDIPDDPNDPITPINTDNFLSAQTAGYVALFVMKNDERAKTCFAAAKESIDEYLTSMVRGQQFQDIRRKRYLNKYRRVRRW